MIEPIFDDASFQLSAVDSDEAVEDERRKLRKFKYEFFSVNSGSSMYKASGTSLKKLQAPLKDRELHIKFMPVA